jgi:hypothetical protein
VWRVKAVTLLPLPIDDGFGFAAVTLLLSPKPKRDDRYPEHSDL